MLKQSTQDIAFYNVLYKTIKKYNVANIFMQNKFAETNLEEQNDHIVLSWNNYFDWSAV